MFPAGKAEVLVPERGWCCHGHLRATISGSSAGGFSLSGKKLVFPNYPLRQNVPSEVLDSAEKIQGFLEGDTSDSTVLKAQTKDGTSWEVVVSEGFFANLTWQDLGLISDGKNPEGYDWHHTAQCDLAHSEGRLKLTDREAHQEYTKELHPNNGPSKIDRKKFPAQKKASRLVLRDEIQRRYIACGLGSAAEFDEKIKRHNGPLTTRDPSEKLILGKHLRKN